MYNCSTQTDCWDVLISGAQIAADCTMNSLYFSPVLHPLTLSFTHSHILFLWPVSIYSLSTYADTSYLTPLHMYYFLEATGATSLAWCNVNGKNKIAKKNTQNKKNQNNTAIIRTHGCILLLSLSKALAYTNKPTQPSYKGKMYRTPHIITGLLRQTVARADTSPVTSMSLWGLFIWDSYRVWRRIPTLANIFSCHSVRQQVSLLDTKWARRRPGCRTGLLNKSTI